MARPSKKDVARRIVTAFPNAGFDRESLVEEYTFDELLKLKSDLETGGADDKQEQSATADLYELGAGFTQYSSVDFSLVEGEQKPLPEHVGSLLHERLLKGHIVPVKKG